MIEIRTYKKLRELMEKVTSPTHFTNDGKIAKVWLNGVESPRGCMWAFSASRGGDPITDHHFSTFHSMYLKVAAFLLGVEVTEGETFYELVNQGDRDCEVVDVKRTRFRIEYEMPNAGMMGAWRKPSFERSAGWYYNPVGATVAHRS